MFARLSFIPTLAYNVAMEHVSTRRWWNRIDKHVVLGALPFKHKVPQLLEEEDVGAVVSMNESYELSFLSNKSDDWKNLNVSFLQLPTTDIFEAPDQHKLQQGVQFIHENIENDSNKSVYVHCKAGRTRSATLVACYLLDIHPSWTPDKAVKFIESRRRHILLGKPQWSAIHKYYESLKR